MAKPDGRRMSETDRQRICDLDVEWFMAAHTTRGLPPFRAAMSEVNGRWYDAHGVALITLHQLRTSVGGEREVAESTAWLRAEGLMGLFGHPLGDN
jgi:hypothetical protein